MEMLIATAIILLTIITLCLSYILYLVFIRITDVLEKMSELIKSENMTEYKNNETQINKEEIENDNYLSPYGLDKAMAKELVNKYDFIK